MQKIIFLVFLIVSQGTVANLLQTFGESCIPASNVSSLLDVELIPIPDTISFQRAPTYNGMGYIFYSISPLGYLFIQNEAVDNRTVLEIGAGFSNIAVECLKKAHVTYIANDVSFDHLKVLVARIKAQYPDQSALLLQRLLLLPARVPHELPDFENVFDALLLDKVFHFFDPDEIELFIAWAKKALKPHGRLYILTLSPYTKFYNARLLADYMSKRNPENLYPGYSEDVYKYIDQQKLKNNPHYKIPPMATFFSRSDLEYLFLQKGFRIEESYSVTLPGPAHETWERVEDDQGDLVALIAENKKGLQCLID